MRNQVLKITALRKFRSKFVGTISMRLVTIAKVQDSHAHLQQSSVREAMLVAYIGQPRADIGLGSALLGHQRRDAVVGRMVIVEEKSNRQDVSGREVHLNFRQVAAAHQVVGVGTGWKLLNIDVVVLRLQAVKKPRALAHDGAGKGEPGNELVEPQSIEFFYRRDKVGRIKAKLVVAHAGVERDHSSRGLAEFDRIPGGFRVNRTHCIRADSHGQLAADGGTDIESIQLVERRIRWRSGNMNLTGCVLHYARSK